jgi:hypothetical protein
MFLDFVLVFFYFPCYETPKNAIKTISRKKNGGEMK